MNMAKEGGERGGDGTGEGVPRCVKGGTMSMGWG